MSTRALYTFRDQDNAWNVYKHHDGYPSGAASVLRNAIDYFAWELPRFEADEFAAAFCAAGKAHYFLTYVTGTRKQRALTKNYLPGGDSYRYSRGGGVRFMPQGEPTLVASNNCADIEYRYEISLAPNGKKLIIRAFAGSWWSSEGQPKERVIFYGPFEDFERAAEKLDNIGPEYSIYVSPKRKRRTSLVEHVSTGRVA